MSDAPERIWLLHCERTPHWIGDAMRDQCDTGTHIEYIRADAIPWEEMKIACYEEFAEPEDRADYAVRVLERVLALREQVRDG